MRKKTTIDDVFNWPELARSYEIEEVCQWEVPGEQDIIKSVKRNSFGSAEFDRDDWE